MSDSQRINRFNIRISDQVTEKLKSYAQELGMAPSTVAAQLVCEGLRTKEMQSRAFQAAIELQNKAALDHYSDPENVSKFLSSLSPEILKSIAGNGQ